MLPLGLLILYVAGVLSAELSPLCFIFFPDGVDSYVKVSVGAPELRRGLDNVIGCAHL